MFDRVLFDNAAYFTTKTSFSRGKLSWEFCDFLEITVAEFFSYQKTSGKYNLAKFELWIKILD